jgi:hypothetical protein
MKRENKLKLKIKELKKEISYLNNLLSEADESSWDLESVYKDIRYGRFNGNEVEGFVPDKKMATWFAKRWNLNEKELEE